mmetsp:Transcript_17562/g.25255  ORF Transcript_17562/g.25255 Transcript_17562/m.25255 type:complete len:87 (+) Transcript_17562:512-772(+)
MCVIPNPGTGEKRGCEGALERFKLKIRKSPLHLGMISTVTNSNPKKSKYRVLYASTGKMLVISNAANVEPERMLYVEISSRPPQYK